MKTEKLELKHIAGYLPWNLPAKLSIQGIFNLDREYTDENDNKIGYLSDFCFNDGEFTGAIKITEKVYYDVEEGDFEIVLRPMSDLTKEIEHNGEKFIPLEKICETRYTYLHNITDITHKHMAATEMFVIEKLYEWHFDIKGLIPAGLAIDINNLK